MQISGIKCTGRLITVYLKESDMILRLPGFFSGRDFFGSLSSLAVCHGSAFRPADEDEQMSFMYALTCFDNHEICIHLGT